MKKFPHAEWAPTRDEYFDALAPDWAYYPGKHLGWGFLHGSGDIKQAEKSPRVFGDILGARIAQRLARAGGIPLTARQAAILETQRSKPWMHFGSAVESIVMPSDPMPEEISEKDKARAETRAEQILDHPEAGRYLRAKGVEYQVAHRWQDPETGLWFRMRLDMAYYTPGAAGKPSPAIQDLKILSGVTAGNLGGKWGKVRKFGADLQAALYRRGCLDLWGCAPPHVLIIADSDLLGPIFVRKLSDRTIEEADARLAAAARTLAECYRAGEFIDLAERPQEI